MIRAVSTAVTPLRKGPTVVIRERRTKLCIFIINLQKYEFDQNEPFKLCLSWQRLNIFIPLLACL